MVHSRHQYSQGFHITAAEGCERSDSLGSVNATRIREYIYIYIARVNVHTLSIPGKANSTPLGPSLDAV